MQSMSRWVVSALAVLALGVAGCGGDDEEAGGGAAGGEAAENAGAPEATTGFDGQTIKLGVLTPLTGPVAVIGEPLTAGNKIFWDAINAEEGGVAGKFKVELVTADTQYQPDRTVRQYNQVKNQVVGFQQVLGTAPTLAVLPQLERDGVLAAPASLDAFWVREENLLPVGAPYQIQAINALDFYVNQMDGKNKTICSMRQDDAYGEAGQEGLEFAAEKLGVEIAQEVTYKVGSQNLLGQVQQLQKADCDMVFLVAVPSDAGTAWGAAARLGFAPQWIGQSPSWIDELAESPLKQYLAKNVLIVAEGTEFGDPEVPGAVQLAERMKKFAPEQEPDYYLSFGYLQGIAMKAVLEKAVELGDLSQKGLVQAAQQVGTVEFNGLSGDYTYGATEERNPPRDNTIFEVDPQKPFGLGVRERGYASEIAKQFEFSKAR